ncbi:hypothetical protein ABUK73_15155 [Agrobacterium sp. BA1120]|uniref:hypothetical protein n=1 Tax=Agrobacterium sp. BA1120 TaxID=3228927 RepID=UPI00336AE190
MNETETVVDPVSGRMLDELQSAVAAERRAVEASLDKIRRWEKAISNLRGVPEVDGNQPPQTTTVRRVHMGSQAHKLRTHVIELLREKNRPLSRSEILEGLASKGVELNFKDPIKRITKIMWEAKEFQHLPTGYWFAGTVPESDTL